ncbi:MAG: hypothetical protein MHM6MM_000148 [Cercozoa sp. M6MM]
MSSDGQIVLERAKFRSGLPDGKYERRLVELRPDVLDDDKDVNIVHWNLELMRSDRAASLAASVLASALKWNTSVFVFTEVGSESLLQQTVRHLNATRVHNLQWRSSTRFVGKGKGGREYCGVLWRLPVTVRNVDTIDSVFAESIDLPDSLKNCAPKRWVQANCGTKDQSRQSLVFQLSTLLHDTACKIAVVHLPSALTTWNTTMETLQYCLVNWCEKHEIDTVAGDFNLKKPRLEPADADRHWANLSYDTMSAATENGVRLYDNFFRAADTPWQFVDFRVFNRRGCFSLDDMSRSSQGSDHRPVRVNLRLANSLQSAVSPSPKKSPRLLVSVDENTPRQQTPTSIACPECHKTFKNKHGLAVHARVHKTKPASKAESTSSTPKSTRVTCPQCGQTCKSERGLAIHVARTHANESDSAHTETETAAVVSPTASDLGSDNSDTRCSLCDRSFKNARGLAIHMSRMHKLE